MILLVSVLLLLWDVVDVGGRGFLLLFPLDLTQLRRSVDGVRDPDSDDDAHTSQPPRSRL